jgi:hypothetical protein
MTYFSEAESFRRSTADHCASWYLCLVQWRSHLVWLLPAASHIAVLRCSGYVRPSHSHHHRPPAFPSCSPAHRSHPPHAHAVGAVSKCTRSFNRYRSPYSKHSIIDTLHDEYTDGRWLTYGDTTDAQNARGSGYHDIAIRAVLPTLVSMLDIWPLRVNAADLDFDLERRGYRHHTGGSARTAVLRSPRYTLFPCPLIRSLNAIMFLQI